jgi:hypothetical protein
LPASSLVVISALRWSNIGNVISESAINEGSVASRRDKASATVFYLPGLYSTVKSYPNSLLTHWCYGIVERR